MVEPGRTASPLSAAVALVLYFLLFLTALAPFSFEYPLPGIEGGWLAASVYATLERFAYGTQFVFTNGPLFPLYHREFAGELSLLYSLARLSVVTFLALGFARLTAGSPRATILLALLAVGLFWPTSPWQTNDGLLVVVPLVTTLLVLAGRGPTWLIFIGVVLAAAISLAKVSLGTFAIGAFLLADMALLVRRRLPLCLVGFALSSFVLFLAAGQSPADFVPFIVGSFEITAGYTAALSVDGPVGEVIAFLAISSLILGFLAVTQWRIVRNGLEAWPIALLRLALAAGLIGFSLKAGFVRHDSHSVAAWGAIGFAVFLLSLPGSVPGWRPRRAVLALALPSLLMGAVLAYGLATGPIGRDLTVVPARLLFDQLADGVSVVRNPAAWEAANAKRADDANAALRQSMPLPDIVGRVDSLSNIQSTLIAAGLDYWPRPTIQENMSYSSALISRNRAFLAGPQAPTTLLFAPGDATDGRHPASIEGSLWPLLLADYGVTAEAGSQLILTRRATPREVVQTPVGGASIRMGEPVPIPSTGALFLRLDIRKTIAGRIAELAYKAPLLHIQLDDGSGKPRSYRLIPGMIAEGMVIAPLIDNAAAYRDLDAGRSLSGLPRARSFTITTDGEWAYEADIAMSLSELSVPPG